MNGAQSQSCKAIREVLSRLGSLQEAPDVRRHVEDCSQCWEHWADCVDAAFSAPVAPMAWERIVSAWRPGPDAAALWALMRELPPYQQPAGTSDESLKVDGVTLQAGSIKLGKNEARWQAVAIDITGHDDELQDQWLVGIYPKEPGGAQQYLAFCAEFTPLKKGGFRATVYLSTQRPDPDSAHPKIGTPTAVEFAVTQSEPAPSAKAVLEGLYLLKLVNLRAPVRCNTDEEVVRHAT